MRGHQAPEAYVCVERVPAGEGPSDTTAQLTAALAGALSSVDGQIAVSDPRSPLPGFAPVVRGRRSWDERIDAIGRLRPWAS
jgi:hypothetical protein